MAKRTFTSSFELDDGRDFLADLASLRRALHAADAHAREHDWHARWRITLRDEAGTVEADTLSDAFESSSEVGARLLQVDALLYPEGQGYGEAPAFILRIERPEGLDGARCWVHADSQTEAAGLVSVVRGILTKGASPAPNKSRNRPAVPRVTSPPAEPTETPGSAKRSPARGEEWWRDPWVVTLVGGLVVGLIVALIVALAALT